MSGLTDLETNISDDFALNGAGANSESTDSVAIPCLLACTRVLTDRGETPLESLAVGDLVVTFSGKGAALKPVTWIGHIGFDASRHPSPSLVWPIRILRGALGEDLPRRDLLVSPGYALLIDGVLIPAGSLLNDATIYQDRAISQGTYFQIELAAHDILLSDGVLAETPANISAADAHHLHPDFSPEPRSGTCKPLELSGPRVAAARHRLLERAKTLGYAVARQSELYLLTDSGELLAPATVIRGKDIQDSNNYGFVLPTPGRSRLLSRTWKPSQYNADSSDERELGLSIGQVLVDGTMVAVDDEALSDGWNEAELYDGFTWRWTKGYARLPAASTIDILVIEEPLGWSLPKTSSPRPIDDARET